jgi:lipopolysaccharide biosynthesis glycosyltransferase
MQIIDYKRPPANDNSELHICYRCSDEYAKYAPVALYSVLVNNPDRYVYVYIMTDGISESKWNKIRKISNNFKDNELFQVIPDEKDIIKQQEKSASYHGWGLISISIYYQKYFRHLKKVFNFGIDSYCVGNLGDIWDQDIEDYHLIGNNNRHQTKTIFKASSRWIGMDVSFINLEKLRKDGITPEKMEDYTVEKIGYIHDEVAHNELCVRKFIDSDYYYIFSGSYLPKRKMSPKTKLVDYYNNLKPWEIAFKGYEVFDEYIKYYQAVSEIVELDYWLPKNNIDASDNLKNNGKPFVDWFPFRHKMIGEIVYRSIWVWKHMKKKLYRFAHGR